ncbi:P-loop containing nucleoside triphosphate hydrolase protein [Rhodocollybia butyracea]|uniref:P-loop containing nucleoside triphosphate hydrolase protein n=1 Tax=Rhodocollybia butyracea TaxID=206335 RepID=A0A9P5Q037_9AGAR|nr:P-loop containing nucleoside triphosphate hydrolase protein [Rhodocollybia butyracea]
MHRTQETSVLGKRAHCQDQSSSCGQLQTPDPTPDSKRVRTSSSVIDGDGNKENIAPFALNALHSEVTLPIVSARAARALRRSATESLQSTPARPKRNERSASISSIPTTPATAISTLCISTPPPTPPTFLPIHIRIRALLRPNCDELNELPGREEERETITTFMQSFIAGTELDDHQSLYISGSPGSGKTALVNSILRLLEEAGDVNVITINCMALADVDALWRRMREELDPSTKSIPTPRSKKQLKGKEAADAAISAMKSKCILVLDELDHIAPNAQVFTSLLALPESSSGLLRVIGIANTHTLSTGSSSDSQVRILHFAPYTSSQLLQILQSRLTPVYDSEKVSVAVKKLLPVSTLTLLTKKVASLTGDVRCLFEVLRCAIDLASVASQGATDILDAPAYSVTPAHIISALKTHTPSTKSTLPSSVALPSSIANSEIVSKICSLGLQARLVLLSVLVASKRLEEGLALSSSGSPSPVAKRSSANNISRKDISIDPQQLHGYYCSILSRGDSDLCAPASRNEFVDLIGRLEGIGLVSVATVVGSSPTKRAFGRSTSFSSAKSKSAAAGGVRLGAGVWVDEVLRGLGIDNPNSVDVKEEEARAIWNSESSRLTKELKVIQAKSSKSTHVAAGFENALED